MVKHLDESQPPWMEQSEYSTLRAECQAWYSSLPESLKFSRSAVQKRKVSGQHGALMLLHITYHQSMCDLTRIGMVELFRIRAPIVFPAEQHEFVQSVQDACFDHCMAFSSVLQEALHHGTEAFADTWLCVVAHDVSRVQIHYAKNRLGSSARHDHYGFASEVNAALSVNFEALHRMIPLLALAKPLVSLFLVALTAHNSSVLTGCSLCISTPRRSHWPSRRALNCHWPTPKLVSMPLEKRELVPGNRSQPRDFLLTVCPAPDHHAPAVPAH